MKVYELLENKRDFTSLLKKHDFLISASAEEIDAVKNHPGGFEEKYVINSTTESWRYEILLDKDIGKTQYGENFESLKKHIEKKNRFSEKTSKKYFS